MTKILQTLRKASQSVTSFAGRKQARSGVTLQDNRGNIQQRQRMDSAKPATGELLQLAIGENGDQTWVIQKSTGERFWAVRNTIGSYDLYQNMTFIMDARPDDSDFRIAGEDDSEEETGLGFGGNTSGSGQPRTRAPRKKRPKETYDDEEELEVRKPASSTNRKKRVKKNEEKAKKKNRVEIENDFSDSLIDDTSDSDLSEVEEVGLHTDRPLSAGATNIFIGDDRITGAQLIKIANDVVRQVVDDIAGDELPQFDEESQSRAVVSGSDWMKSLGTMDKMISGKQRRPLHEGANFKSMEHPIAPRTGSETGNLVVGNDRSRMTFKLQNKMVRVAPESQDDFEYEDLIKQLTKLRDSYNLTDSDIAAALVQLIRTGGIAPESPLARDPQAINLLNFINTLGIGVEGSRLNVNAFHHVSILEDVFSGFLSLEQAFFTPPYGGAFPMATTGGQNQNGQIATRRQGLLDSEALGTRGKPRGGKKLWEKDSKKRKGRVASLRSMRASQSSHLVILKEAINLVNIGRRLIISEGIEDMTTFVESFKRYIRNTMLENFGGETKPDTPYSVFRRSSENVIIPPVKVNSVEEAYGRSWNVGDRFELAGDDGRYYVVLKNHRGGEKFARGGIWMKLRGG